MTAHSVTEGDLLRAAKSPKDLEAHGRIARIEKALMTSPEYLEFEEDGNATFRTSEGVWAVGRPVRSAFPSPSSSDASKDRCDLFDHHPTCARTCCEAWVEAWVRASLQPRTEWSQPKANPGRFKEPTALP